MKESVLILMATYNGEKYLRVQLDSIINQKEVSVHILVRDDGSSDGTVNILKDYSSRFNNITIIEGNNCGAIWSFYKLMDCAVREYSDYEYFAFSDQDDYWYPDKLKRAINKNTTESDNFFYHSCYDIVDENLNIISKSNIGTKNGTLGEALISNFAIGCSEVFTYKVLKEASKINHYSLSPKGNYPYHDLWVYLVALSTGADIVFDDYCSLKYRQHGNNVIGIGATRRDIFKLQKKNLLEHKNIKSGFAKILLDLLNVDSYTEETLRMAADYQKSIGNKYKLLTSNRFAIKDKVRRMAFVYSVITNFY